MQPKDLLLHCYYERAGDVWLAFCLDFTLVAQAESLNEAAKKLDSQIREYLHDSLIGDDRQHARYLMTRRAPIIYWIKFWVSYCQQQIGKVTSKRRKSIFEPVPLVPALC